MVTMTVSIALLCGEASAQDISQVISNLGVNTTVGTALNKLRDTAEDVIGRAEIAGNNVAYVAGSQVLTAINAYEASNSRLLDKAFKGLSDQQYNFFSSTTVALQRIQDTADLSLFKAQGLINQTGTLMQMVPFTKEIAVISSYNQILVPPADDGQQSIILKFQGFGFNYGTPRLIIGKYEITGKPTTSNAIEFVIPVGWAGFQETKASYLKGKLFLSEPQPRGFLKKLGDALLARPAPLNTREFDLRWLVLPRQVAQWQVKATYGDMQRQEEIRREFVGFNSGNDDYACQSYPFRVRGQGRKIDGDPQRTEISDNFGNTTFANKSEESFTVVACAKGFRRGALNPRKYNGWTHSVIQWKEYWMTATSPTKTDAGVLLWRQQWPIELPATTEKFILTLKTFENKELIADGTQDLEYVQVTYNPATKVIILRPNQWWTKF